MAALGAIGKAMSWVGVVLLVVSVVASVTSRSSAAPLGWDRSAMKRWCRRAGIVGILATVLGLTGHFIALTLGNDKPLSTVEVASRLNGTWVDRKGRMVTFAFTGDKGTVTIDAGQGPSTAPTQIGWTWVMDNSDGERVYEGSMPIYPDDPNRLNYIRIMIREDLSREPESLGLEFRYFSRTHATGFKRVR